MKRIVIIAMMVMAALSAQAQNRVTSENNLQSYKESRLKKIPTVQAYQATDGTILKGADAFGWGIEPFVGASAFEDGRYITPEAGVNFRFDQKRWSARVGASALYRQYNAEAIDAGQDYLSYCADAALHVNLVSGGYYRNILNVFVTGGYMFGKHNYKVGEAEVEEGTILTSVRHNGSGLTWGGGLEYRAQFFATGNALTIRVGYKNVPNTYVNNTKHNGMLYAQVGFNIGVARCRVKNGK